MGLAAIFVKLPMGYAKVMWAWIFVPGNKINSTK
jgi:hypothetical protein